MLSKIKNLFLTKEEKINHEVKKLKDLWNKVIDYESKVPDELKEEIRLQKEMIMTNYELLYRIDNRLEGSDSIILKEVSNEPYTTYYSIDARDDDKYFKYKENMQDLIKLKKILRTRKYNVLKDNFIEIFRKHFYAVFYEENGNHIKAFDIIIDHINDYSTFIKMYNFYIDLYYINISDIDIGFKKILVLPSIFTNFSTINSRKFNYIINKKA